MLLVDLYVFVEMIFDGFYLYLLSFLFVCVVVLECILFIIDVMCVVG